MSTKRKSSDNSSLDSDASDVLDISRFRTRYELLSLNEMLKSYLDKMKKSQVTPNRLDDQSEVSDAPVVSDASDASDASYTTSHVPIRSIWPDWPNNDLFEVCWF